MTLEIETGHDNPILRQPSKPIDKFDKELKKLAKDMTETMLAKDGLGLAAPQVGINQRIIVINFQNEKSRPIPMINPVITQASQDFVLGEEGCLSLPGESAKVQRHASITVEYQNEDSKTNTLELDGINARAVQHEIDHLNGILFVDRAEGKVIDPKTKFPKPDLSEI